MEVMEEGNLMDRVPILLQRDLQYYQTHQTVLQEPICSGVVGGKLDFPRCASFAAIKIVLWWEDEYFASYRKHSGLLHTEKQLAEEDFSSVIVKASDPDKFVQLVTKSADLLLEHLHMLSQESLDHADLTVLTATIGAAALIRNCLSVYLRAATVKIYPPKGNEKGGALKLSLKQFSQLSEALAERLLDLHCRLLLLYVIQEADALHWEAKQEFFESERGSYTIQMWWLYMCGTKDDLWNTVSPKMAQSIFAGMLNETLSILSVRYSHIITSTVRAQLHLIDISNLLLCVAELLPHVSENAEAYIGLQLTNQSIIIRDIHAKCRELFYCLLLRGAPLGVLSKIFRKGLENMELFSSRQGLPSAWIIFSLPHLFPKDQNSKWVTEFSDLKSSTAISLELKVMLASPQANWPYLVKILLMRDAYLTGLILRHLLKHLPSPENFKNVTKSSWFDITRRSEKCKGFLCRGECYNISKDISKDIDPIGQSNYQIVLALTYILIAAGKAVDIKLCLIKTLEESPNTRWSECLDKRQIWNQKRPPWLEAIIHFIYPTLEAIVNILITSVESGASMYQAMALALRCFSEIWACIPEGFYKVTKLLQDIIPVTTRPLSDSVLFQILFAALYTELIRSADLYERIENDGRANICYTLSEAICSIDENDKHTDQIDLFLRQTRETLDTTTKLTPKTAHAIGMGNLSAVSTIKIDDLPNTSGSIRFNHNTPSNYALELDVGITDYIAELLTSDILTTSIGCQALKISYKYLRNNKDWLLEQLRSDYTGCDLNNPNKEGQNIHEMKSPLLRTMFLINHQQSFDQMLIGTLKIDYTNWLQMPLSLNMERAWLHLSRRSDFQEDNKLTMPEIAMVATIMKIMKAKQQQKNSIH